MLPLQPGITPSTPLGPQPGITPSIPLAPPPTPQQLEFKQTVPVQITSSQEGPADPELCKIAEDILQGMKFSFMANAVTDDPTPKMKVAGSIDVIFRQYLNTRKPAAKAKAKQKSQAYLEEPEAVRKIKYGRYGTLSLNKYREVGYVGISKQIPSLQVESTKLAAFLKNPGNRGPAVTQLPTPVFEIKGQTLRPLCPPKIVLPPSAPPAQPSQPTQPTPPVDPDVTAGAAFKKLRLYIKLVQCKEETDGLGSDEILMGGTATSPDGVTTQQIAQFKVSDDFDTGETVEYPGLGKLFAEWDISTDASAGWPKAYSAVMAMAEEDSGGFHDFLEQLWEKIGEDVRTAVITAVGAAVGTAIGSTIGGIVGAIAGFLIGAFIDWIIGLFEDDIIAVMPVTAWLYAATGTYYASTGFTTTPISHFATDFNGEGGRYRVWSHFKLSTA